MSLPARFSRVLDPNAPSSQLAELFLGEGFDLFLVGGSVRDAFLGSGEDNDLDYTTIARPADIKRIMSPWADELFAVGEAFGTIGAIKDGYLIEVTTFRAEVYRAESRKPEISFSDDIETDLSRRDFTANAMALKLGSEPALIDPYGGLSDIAAKVLRTPLAPEIAFEDDPLRMLRMYRFVSQLGFTPDESAVAATRSMADRLSIVSAERIRDELIKLLQGEHVEEGLWGLIDSGLAEQFLPELPALALEVDPDHHHKDVLAHTIAVVGKAPPNEDVRLRLAALLHDIGKPATREFEGRRVTFHHHEVVGARMTRARMRELRFPKDDIQDVSQLVFLHMRPHTFKMGWTDRAVRRYVRDAGPLLEDLNELVRCDVTTRNEKRARSISRRIDEMEQRIEELAAKEELDAIRPPIDGNSVMKHLGLE
ncbi:MAG: CCA tRNA nucleotidyltransferase, partial [Acidimicrobiia bacterium]|nr:CCA tRNA nucleotidyltransferase [Acidimicrobiia bacterium]